MKDFYFWHIGVVIIFYNGSYLFSNATIGGLSYFFVYRLAMVLFDRSEGMGTTPSSFIFFFLLLVNSTCGNCIPTKNAGFLPLFLERRGI